jgi:hypothetical protein
MNLKKIIREKRIVPIGSVATFFFILLLSSCNPNDNPVEDQAGKLKFYFQHRVDGEPIVFDDMRYVNEAGNHYLVNEIQYFISDVTLHKSDGSELLLDEWEDIHYVDTDIPSTQTYAFKDDIPIGDYDKITFTFGISEEKNQSLMFVNPPESFMFWPEQLGGGYHYMKLNGKWLDTLDQVSPFNFHLGIGQIYYSFPDSITSFVQNYFEVTLSNSDFKVQSGKTTDLVMVMNVENWFKSPNTFDFNDWGGDIMQKQDAMHLASENGWDVFTVEKVLDDK